MNILLKIHILRLEYHMYKIKIKFQPIKCFERFFSPKSQKTSTFREIKFWKAWTIIFISYKTLQQWFTVNKNIQPTRKIIKMRHCIGERTLARIGRDDAAAAKLDDRQRSTSVTWLHQRSWCPKRERMTRRDDRKSAVRRYEKKCSVHNARVSSPGTSSWFGRVEVFSEVRLIFIGILDFFYYIKF